MDYLIGKDIADMFKVNIRTVDRWREKGLPSIKIGRLVRYEKQVVEEWVKNQK